MDQRLERVNEFIPAAGTDGIKSGTDGTKDGADGLEAEFEILCEEQEKLRQAP